MSNRISIYMHYVPNPARYYYNQLPESDYGPGVVAFYAPGPEPGAIPIYCHQWMKQGDGDPDRYFYDQQIPNNANWTNGQLAFYAYKSPVAKSVPIYQYRGDYTYYYFTADPEAGWTKERIAFYAYPPDRIPIYRHYANSQRYFYDKWIPNNHGWSSPGVVAFYAAGQAKPGAIPIYRHQWMKKGDGDPDRYFYDQQIPNNANWTKGELAFYAHKSPVAETVPIYQYRGENTYYYFTADPEVPGWTKEGVAFYAYPPDFLGITAEVRRTLARKPDENKGVTYLRTSGNKFTRLDTPGLWGPTAKDNPRTSAASRKLLDSITEVIGGATQILDLTFLYNADPNPRVSAFPDGDFQKAISDGFKTLIASGRTPSIRILFGVPLGGWWRYIRPPISPKAKPAHSELMDLEKAWLRQTIELDQTIKLPGKYKLSQMKCPILVAHGRSTSWNHTKIIVADDKIAITGGHNCYDDDYLGATPTHDVSGVFAGPAAKGARLFCDKLWTKTAGRFTLIKGSFGGEFPNREDIYRQMPAPGTRGNLEMLSLGRMGKGLVNDFNISSNASVTARIAALCKAKNTIRISQQSFRAIALLGPLTPPLYDFYTCLAIVRAVKAGVNVEIVLSGEAGKGYGGAAQNVLQFLQLLYLLDILPSDSIPLPSNHYYSQICHAAPHRESINEWVDLGAGSGSVVNENAFDLRLVPSVDKDRVYAGFRTKWNVDAHIAVFNKKLKLATLYSSDNSQSSNHSKVYIIDGDCFYVGSDNMYPSQDNKGLQEFGYLIEDKTETQKFIQEYWSKLWEYSQKHPLN
jgi:phosphatidylserine/phosphatidylglycerophosphate/cardiolipin synthase-like enzyme